MNRLNKRKILITGASRGIGAAICRRLLEDGAQVIGIARDFSAWNNLPEGMSVYELDLTRLDDLPDRLKQITQDHPDLDGLVLNAGDGRFGGLENHSYRQIQDAIEMNLVQHLFVARACLPVLKDKICSDIIIMGSEAGLRGGPQGALYSACKHALRGFAQSMRQDGVKSGMRVCIINPGFVESDFYQAQRFQPGAKDIDHLRPEDIANTVAMVLGSHPGTVYDEININPLQRVIQFKS